MRILKIALAMAIVLGPVFVAPAAMADPIDDRPPGVLGGADNPPPGTVGHREFNTWNSYIEIVGVRVNQLNPRYLAKCGVDSPRQTCTINRTRTVTNEISAQFGATAGGLTSGVGMSTSEAIALQIGCQSPPMNTGEEYLAFPTENHYYYRVVSDGDAHVTDAGEYISDGVWDFSPVAMAAVYDEGFRCRVRPQPPS